MKQGLRLFVYHTLVFCLIGTLFSCSEQSSRSSFATDPEESLGVSVLSAPRSLKVSGGVDGEAPFFVLSWEAPESDGGNTITHYQYRQHAEGEESFGDWIDIPDSGGGEINEFLYKIISGVSEGATYTFQIRAINKEHKSEASSEEGLGQTLFLGESLNQKSVPLFVYQGEGWFYMCYEGFNLESAHMVCGQLGYNKVKNVEPHTPSSENRGILSARACTGAEETLFDCPLFSTQSLKSQRLGSSQQGDSESIDHDVLLRDSSSLSSLGITAEEDTCQNSEVVAISCQKTLSAPVNLLAAAGDTEVTLTWTATPPESDESPLMGHQYRQKVSGEELGPWTDISNSGPDQVHFETYTVQGLQNGETYTFIVRSVNESEDFSLASNKVHVTPLGEGSELPAKKSEHKGWSPESGEVSTTPTEQEITAPSPPRNIVVYPSAWNSINITMEIPKSDGGSPVHRYEVNRGGVDNENWSLLTNNVALVAEGGVVSHTVPTGRSHQFRFRAVNEIGPSPPSEVLTVDMLNLPEAPSNFEVSANGASEVRVEWDNPPNYNGISNSLKPLITGYEYRQKVSGGGFGDWMFILDSHGLTQGSNSGGFTLRGLNPSTSYNFQVRLVTAFGSGSHAQLSLTTKAKDSAPALTGLLRNREDNNVTFYSKPGVKVTQKFTTGPKGAFFKKVRFFASDAEILLSVQLHTTDSSGLPYDILSYLVPTGRPSWYIDYSAPEAVFLEPHTSYFVTADPRYYQQFIITRQDTQTGLNRWTIDNKLLEKDSDGGWREHRDSGALLVSLSGYTNRISKVTIDSSPHHTGRPYFFGESIRFKTTFSQAVRVIGNPTLYINMGGRKREAHYVGGSGTANLFFLYKVTRKDWDRNGVRTCSGSGIVCSRKLKGGSFLFATREVPSQRNQAGHKVRGGRFVSGVEMVSTPENSSDTYGLGERIEVALRAAEAMFIQKGASIFLDVGGVPREAPYLRGSGTKELIFGYTVVSGDLDNNGVRICPSSWGPPGCSSGIKLNGQTFKNRAEVKLPRKLPAQSSQPGHKVSTP